MKNMDGPLDFEFEDPLRPSPLPVNRRKKVIGLDDLLTDYYKEKSKVIERESKRAKSGKHFDSDEDEDDKETFLLKKIDHCHDQACQLYIWKLLSVLWFCIFL
ncbi:hypothetical protein Tsubulata_009719 [Turnera subulata]|uniref:Uncharacterized protein n=1 Tax=Turnera subulata TaxID=218843 RepID=A0A9Q0F4X7_9ROSI|nr:hypothetical protein Tsubulata_009719 [Turnera subulata]